MSNLNTELMTALLKKESLDDFFRSHLEDAINDLLQNELTAFLGYEKYSSEGIGTGNSRNGSYSRGLDTKYGKLNLIIPRDRNGSFEQHLVPGYARRTDDLETTIITLYRKGITTREITDLIEKLYGHYYTPATVSNIARAVQDQVNVFHTRELSERYVVIYMDATYLNIRRNSVAKEPLHVLLGITPDGNREVLDYALFPTESASNYEEMLENIKKRGVKQVLLFASDGLQGMRDAVKRQFPDSEHQQCWVHLSRTVARRIRNKDRKAVLGDLKAVYGAPNAEKAQEALDAFLEKYRGSYPRLHEVFDRAQPSLFPFYSFPEEIRCSLYTTNLIERNNKGLKHTAKVKEQFPNEESLERYVCCYYSDSNRKYSERAMRGFKQVSAELLQMFEPDADKTASIQNQSAA